MQASVMVFYTDKENVPHGEEFVDAGINELSIAIARKEELIAAGMRHVTISTENVFKMGRK